MITCNKHKTKLAIQCFFKKWGYVSNFSSIYAEILESKDGSELTMKIKLIKYFCSSFQMSVF